MNGKDRVVSTGTWAREQAGRRNTASTQRAPLVVTISSGKGGVGKTLTTVNLAIAARRMGFSVLILDGDLGLSNVDVVLGLTAKYNIMDVLEGTAQLRDIVLTGPMGIRIIPSGSGIAKLTNLSYVQRIQILEQIDALDERPDLLLIDTGAGIAENVLHFSASADHTIVVTTPEPHAMTDAYAFIKVMSEEHKQFSFKLLVNMAHSADEALKVSNRIAEVALQFLNVKVDYLGFVPMDPQVQRSVAMRRAASEQSTFTIAGQAWNEVTRQILAEIRPGTGKRDAQQFWRQLLTTRQGGNGVVGATA